MIFINAADLTFRTDAELRAMISKAMEELTQLDVFRAGICRDDQLADNPQRRVGCAPQGRTEVLIRHQGPGLCAAGVFWFRRMLGFR